MSYSLDLLEAIPASRNFGFSSWQNPASWRVGGINLQIVPIRSHVVLPMKLIATLSSLVASHLRVFGTFAHEK